MLIPRFAIVARALSPEIRQAAVAARMSGFDGLQLDAITRQLDVTTLSTTGYRELRHVFSSNAQTLFALRCEAGPEGLGPKSDTDRILDRADGVLRASAALGCTGVCFDLGRLPPAPRAAKLKPKVTPQMAGLLILPESKPAEPAADEPPATKIDPAVLGYWQQALAALADIADRYGQLVSIGTSLSSLASLVAIVTSVNCPWFGIDFDTSAVVRDEWSADEFFDAAAPLLQQVRARDAVAGEDRRSRPAVIGRGDVKWRELLAGLDAAGYAGPITIDPTELAEPTVATVAGLKQLKAVLSS